MINKIYVKNIYRRLRYGIPFQLSDEWKALEEGMAKSKRIVDLGCGTNPHRLASVGVDAFIEPVHRHNGYGLHIDSEKLKLGGCKFIQSDLSNLPFPDKDFDFAYSHHVFEHLFDPKAACKEMARVAKRGVIVTPAPFAEIAFGRPYHLWLVFSRGNTIFFVRKKPFEDRPFGDHPEMVNSKWRVNEKTNPFDILLNEGGWYHGFERMSRLRKKLQKLWNSRSPVIDTIFLWEDNFNCVVINEDGTIE